MFLYKRNAIWYVAEVKGGRRIARSTHCRRKSDALRHLHTPQRCGNAQTMKERYLEWSAIHHRPSTHQRITDSIKALDSSGIRWPTPDCLEHFKRWRLKAGKRVSTVNIDLRHLMAFFRWCRRHALFGDDIICECIQEDVELPRYLSVEEFQRLEQCVTPPHIRACVNFAVRTGLRIGEIVAIRDEHVNWQFHTLRIGHTKSRSDRLIPLSPEAEALLLFVIKYLPLTSRNYIEKRFRQAVAVAGLPGRVRFHSLRHTFASWLVQGGVSLYQVQKLLGHSSPVMTQRYAHLQHEDLREVVKKISLPR